MGANLSSVPDSALFGDQADVLARLDVWGQREVAKFAHWLGHF